MTKEIFVAVDAMGGDNAPQEIVKGCILALKEKEKLNILLVGQEKVLNKLLLNEKYDERRIEIINATEVISFEDIPSVVLKEKKDSSITVGIKLLKEKKADAFISAGNTGALLLSATVNIKRIKGVKRPALGTILPTEKGYIFLMDCGSNVDCKPEHLVQFAKIGSIYMENAMKIDNPKVGLLNIGVEKQKGNLLTKDTYNILENENINFIGNVEARDISKGITDVLVCDGFVGNIVLKHTEGLSKSIFSIIKKGILSSFRGKIGALFLKKTFSDIKKKFDYSEVGGAPFLGLQSLVIKTHGSADRKAIKNSIFQAVEFVETDIIRKVENNFVEKEIN